MTDPLDFDLESGIPSQHRIITPIIDPLVTPTQGELDIYPLSPLHFEECSLETLWTQQGSQHIVIEPLSFSSLKNRNGLKNLSWHIKEIVDKQKMTTYAKVADELLIDLEIPQTKIPLRDEKNIRRRVYDALNVLIAAGVLLKHGKYVTPANTEDPSKVVDSDVIKFKRQKLKNLVDCCIATKNLYERNNMQSKHSHVVSYPLSVFKIHKKTKYDVKALKDGDDTTVSVKINGKYELITDINILKKIGLHRKGGDLPLELKSLCKKT